MLAAGGGRYSPEQRGGQLWDVATGALLLRLETFSDTVFGVAFSPDGKTLATGSGDPWGYGPGSTQLWDVTTGDLLAEFGLPNEYVPSHMGTVYNVAYSPDGALVAAINGDGRVQLYDVVTGKEQAVLLGHNGWGNSAAFSRDGKLLATGSAGSFHDIGGDARLWDVATGEQIAQLEGHTSPVKSIVFSPDGQIVATGSLSGHIRLWDVRTAEVVAALESPNGTSSLAFSADGALLAAGSWDGVVQLWSVPGR
jgi:WD40 repeat protein